MVAHILRRVGSLPCRYKCSPGQASQGNSWGPDWPLCLTMMVLETGTRDGQGTVRPCCPVQGLPPSNHCTATLWNPGTEARLGTNSYSMAFFYQVTFKAMCACVHAHTRAHTRDSGSYFNSSALSRVEVN